jgi:hypothetical protein
VRTSKANAKQKGQTRKKNGIKSARRLNNKARTTRGRGNVAVKPRHFQNQQCPSGTREAPEGNDKDKPHLQEIQNQIDSQTQQMGQLQNAVDETKTLKQEMMKEADALQHLKDNAKQKRIDSQTRCKKHVECITLSRTAGRESSTRASRALLTQK